MKVKILIPAYNDWQSVFKLIENINNLQINQKFEISVIIIYVGVIILILFVSNRVLRKSKYYKYILNYLVFAKVIIYPFS